MATSILKPLYGGDFLAESGERLAFVLPGEVVEDGAISAHATGRVSPGCVHFGECGGCQYQHVDYPTQIAYKRQILLELLGIGDFGIRAHSAAAWGYRNRVRLRMEDLAVGYNRRSTNRFLPVRMCPIAAPLLWRAAETLQKAAESDARWSDFFSEIDSFELFSDGAEQQLQVQFLLRDCDLMRRGPGLFAALCERLKAEIPELAGAGAVLDPELKRRVRRRWVGVGWGAAGINYPAAGRTYWVSRGAFFQVNRFLVDTLVGLVCDGTAGTLSWDLFAGVGLFSRELAERFDAVVAVEAGEIAAGDLFAAAKGGKNGRGFEAVRATAMDFLRARELQRERPELIVLDPPRAGLGPEAAEILARIGAERVVYVSCDPTTLARDLAVLVRGGYEVRSVDLVDLFPQTFHVETVVGLGRR